MLRSHVLCGFLTALREQTFQVSAVLLYLVVNFFPDFSFLSTLRDTLGESNFDRIFKILCMFVPLE